VGDRTISLPNLGADSLFSVVSSAVAIYARFLPLHRIAYFYHMKISFGTKEEHKRQKQEEFLALSPVERIYAFLRLSSRIAEFPTAQKNNEPTQNFVVKPKNQA